MVAPGVGIIYLLYILLLVIGLAFATYSVYLFFKNRFLAGRVRKHIPKSFWQRYWLTYNLAMAVSGGLGMLFIYVNSPLIYMVAALFFNLVYSALAIIDVVLKKCSSGFQSKKLFISYFIGSTSLVLFGPAFLLLYLSARAG